MTSASAVPDLVRAADTLSAAVAAFEQPAVNDPLDQLETAALTAQKAWSGSWFGYHSRVYYKDFKPPPAGALFSSEWGFQGAFSNPTRGDWVEYAYDDAVTAIKGLAGNPDLSAAEESANQARSVFDECKADVISLITACLSSKDDPVLQSLLAEARELSVLTYDEACRGLGPPGQIMTRDHPAAGQGIQIGPHHAVLARVVSLRDAATSCSDLEKVARRAAAHLDRLTTQRDLASPSPHGERVFIGHGQSPLWRELKDFISDRLGLQWDEFNRVPVAGFTNIARLAEMLDNAGIAFLVLTAEDEHLDGGLRARMNVIHEAGLFQGRLGFSRAIIVLEDTCEEFSNIQGLGQIRFPSGNIPAAFEEIRRVLERENFIPHRD